MESLNAFRMKMRQKIIIPAVYNNRTATEQLLLLVVNLLNEIQQRSGIFRNRFVRPGEEIEAVDRPRSDNDLFIILKNKEFTLIDINNDQFHFQIISN